MNKRIRQYIGILCALVCYYIIHEGAHLFYALYHGVFKQINLMALGVQIDIYRDQLSDSQLGWFCLAGPLATFVLAWILILLRHVSAPVAVTCSRPAHGTPPSPCCCLTHYISASLTDLWVAAT